jgi:hypothetical protein
VWILSGTQQKLTLIRRSRFAFDEAASVFFDPLAVSGSEPDHSAQSPFFASTTNGSDSLCVCLKRDKDFPS